MTAGSERTSTMWQRARHDPGYSAFVALHIGYAALPFVMGADKFTNLMTDWPAYLAPWIVGLLPFSAQAAMYVVGVIEMAAGIAVALKPRYAGYVITVWLAGIIVDLVTYSAFYDIAGFYDIAIRDFGLMVGGFALARLASVYDRPRAGSES